MYFTEFFGTTKVYDPHSRDVPRRTHSHENVVLMEIPMRDAALVHLLDEVL
jgi:hypothetical protein